MEELVTFILDQSVFVSVHSNYSSGSIFAIRNLIEELEILENAAAGESQTSHRPPRSLSVYNSNLSAWYLTTVVFKANFRMLPSTVEELIRITGCYLQVSILGRPAVDIKRQILLSIWVIANQESFRGVSQRFDLDRGHAWVVFARFVTVLFGIRSRFFNREKSFRSGRIGFQTLRSRSIPGTVGAIDGCQIPIKAPKRDKASYFNRKQYYSVNLQAVCDHQKLFVDVFAGWPGSSHDSRVFRKSSLYYYLENGRLDDESHLIGDSGYPVRKHLLVPFKDNGRLTEEQRFFNKVLSSNRSIIEQAFGLLVLRFRRLKYLDMSNMKLLPKVIVVACVLHNICIECNDNIEEELEDLSQRFDSHTCYDETSNEGVTKRNSIARQLYSNQ